MKIYTKTGDAGQTGLVGTDRVAKNSPRIEAIGTIDELNSHIGLLRSYPIDDDLDEILFQIQNDLFQIGAITATPSNSDSKIESLPDQRIAQLENMIDRLQQSLLPLENFILPDGTPVAAATHLARSVCRRSERRLLSLIDETGNGKLGQVLIYLNRLSDLLFVLARTFNARGKYTESIWRND
jgi:cob(I)alamin adenosyltransferase